MTEAWRKMRLISENRPSVSQARKCTYWSLKLLKEKQVSILSFGQVRFFIYIVKTVWRNPKVLRSCRLDFPLLIYAWIQQHAKYVMPYCTEADTIQLEERRMLSEPAGTSGHRKLNLATWVASCFSN